MTNRRPAPQYLDGDEIAPAVDLASCFQFHEDQNFHYGVPGHHLILLESGRIEARTPHSRFTANAGDLVCFRFAPINEYSTRGPSLFYQVHLSFASPPRHRLTPWLDGVGPIPERITLGNRFGGVRRLFETCCIELDKPGEAHRFRVRAAVFEILAVISDVCARKPAHQPSLDLWQRARLRLGSEFTTNVTIDDFARRNGLSVDHFIRGFRRRFGLTPKAFQKQARLAEAARLLRSADEPVKAIAFQVGFADPKSFTRAFHAHFGVAPSALRGGSVPRLENGVGEGRGPFPMNRHILPPHAGPRWLRKWEARKST